MLLLSCKNLFENSFFLGVSSFFAVLFSFVAIFFLFLFVFHLFSVKSKSSAIKIYWAGKNNDNYIFPIFFLVGSHRNLLEIRDGKLKGRGGGGKEEYQNGTEKQSTKSWTSFSNNWTSFSNNSFDFVVGTFIYWIFSKVLKI